jgi:uncharacterized protein (DUF1501 family)
MKRRILLQSGLMTGLMGAGIQLHAAPATQNRLLLVFLRGGYDSANLLVPVSSNFYYESRPGIAIAKPDPANLQSSIALDGNWALHPGLRETIAPMFARKEVAFIPFAGTNDLSRSHFETQDSIEAGAPAQSMAVVNSGFLNRLAQVMGGAPISFTDALPTVFKGEVGVANISLKGVGKPAFDPRQSGVLAAMYQGSRMEAAVREGLDLRQEVAKEFDQEMQMANRGAISAKGFELEARRIARLMKERYQLGFVDVGGWDTHVNQGGAQGALANNLSDLGRGLAGFAQEMGPQWKQTVVVVVSEFGRTFRENGTRGTDHGHGTVYWVLGGGLAANAAGKVAGEQMRIERSTLFQNRDYPVLNEYRAVLAGLFGRMFGLSGTELDRVFPGVHARDIGLL